ncbi:glycosyltransferase family 2 protein [Chryseosolibacter indicus]|uniref:Glycosyltransferase family 2 protein n=1 Tax=Chryseosolibacter indicus TaxID=2782351 RepID=A0ABS5VNQ5_9BACT|nr:glycosyltransferase family 2 protein [Chryseosolibacter indicus]MBT1701656.1 glycosyltransferase family 2 protein [Chryseosolibacter indicus]
MKVAIIISTYNSPLWLEKVLWGYAYQNFKDFSITIADDGSGPETKQLINQMRDMTGMSIDHVWHEHKGYRRQTILNKAIIESKADYLIFTDGDCIPRADFVKVHIEQAEKGRFLSGGYCKISMKLSETIGIKDVQSQLCFNLSWLKSIDKVKAAPSRKLWAKGGIANFLDYITPTKPTFNNCNSSAWREDILAVKGYDERMKYGGSDREIGERLTNYGVKGKQIRHRAIVLHLDHERGYKTKESIEANLAIRKNTRKNNITETPFGIKQRQNTEELVTTVQAEKNSALPTL